MPMRLPLPSQCDVCRQWGDSRVCGECVARFAAPGPRCGRCARRWPAGGGGSCGACLRSPPPPEHTICVADYDFPWDRLIIDFKFRGQAELASVLAGLLQAPLAAAALPRPDLVVPVPLSPQRLAERGYNQAWELARRIARRRGLAARADVLSRPVDTAHQADLTRARRLQNLRAAFIVEPRARPAVQGRRVALVDDVMTTGATVNEAARTLLQAGAAAVDVWVLARTPED